jgi:NAD(P)-dependent dehydrogenase (short-subunit alcohol dehydrogenase family)
MALFQFECLSLCFATGMLSPRKECSHLPDWFDNTGRVWDTPLDAFAQTMAVNYLGVVHSVKAVLPGMLERGRGRILLVSSIVACTRNSPAVPFLLISHCSVHT